MAGRPALPAISVAELHELHGHDILDLIEPNDFAAILEVLHAARAVDEYRPPQLRGLLERRLRRALSVFDFEGAPDEIYLRPGEAA